MALNSLTDIELLNLIKEKAKHERSLTLEVINLIREVEKRRLYLHLNFGSLFEYVTKELGFEESAANRRISASRLIRDFPETESAIRDGSLSLSNIVQAQVFIRREEKLKAQKLHRDEKKKVIDLVKNRSARSAKKILLKLSPEQVVLKETLRQVAPEHVEVKVILNETVISDLEKLRKLLSHKNPNMTYAELIGELATMALKRLDPELKVSRKKSTQNEKTKTPTSAVEQVEPSNSRYISQEVKSFVWKRDKGQCVFKESANHLLCGSKYQLEYHHEIPFANGGHSTIENIKLHCKRHNIYRAIGDFGKEMMLEFTPRSVTGGTDLVTA